MAREPIQVGPEEGGRMQIKPPPPANDEDVALAASIRVKMASGERLSPEEKRYLTRLPDHDVRYQK